MPYVLKIVLTTALVIAVSEASKRSTLIGGLLASVPLVSVLAMIWLYRDTQDLGKIAGLSKSIFWLVLPSLTLFLVLPPLLAKTQRFGLSLALSIGATVLCYGLMLLGLRAAGIKL
ncbi:MAG: DUF3147 family protein [Planctomycetota bacterium]